MAKVLKDSFNHLYEIADSQGGFFTAKQATAAGYSTRMQTYHVQAGDWDREWRGIYRLHFYPNPRPDDLIVWYLWSSNRSGIPEGVYSHDTALEIHELSTWTSNRLHLTVPPNFKRRSVPKALRLHKGELKQSAITKVGHVAVTSPVRTLLDLLETNTVQRHHLVEAMQQALDRGLITTADLSAGLTQVQKSLLAELVSESHTYMPEG